MSCRAVSVLVRKPAPTVTNWKTAAGSIHVASAFLRDYYFEWQADFILPSKNVKKHPKRRNAADVGLCQQEGALCVRYRQYAFENRMSKLSELAVNTYC